MPVTNYLPSSRLIQPGVCTSTTRPASPFEGQAIFETDTDRMLIWNGSTWVMPNQNNTNPDGLDLITTVTCSSGGTATNGIVTVGTTVSAVVVETAFSSSYENYRIHYTGGVGSTSHGLQIQFGIGSSMTATNYFGGAAFINAGANAWQHVADNGTAQATNVGGGGSTYTSLTLDVYQPNLARNTFFSGGFQQTDFGRFGITSYGQISTTQFTSFRIAPSSGTLTGGTIRVYGYRNS